MEISIIMPVYNAEKYLYRSIKSVLKQSYSDWELLIIDDGSRDDSLEICKSLAMQDNRIRLFTQKHSGQAKARNLGLNKAEGNYIAFLDADDYMHPDMLNVLYGNIVSYQADMAVVDFATSKKDLCKRKNISDGICEVTSLNHDSRTQNEIAKKSNVFLWNKLYQKDLFGQVKFESNRYYEDTALMHVLFDKAQRIVWSDKKLYFYYQNPKGTVLKISEKKVEDGLWAYGERIKYYYHKRYNMDLENAMHMYLYKAYEWYDRAAECPNKKNRIRMIISKDVKLVFDKFQLEKLLPFHGKIRYKMFLHFPLAFLIYTKLKKLACSNSI